jgi:hypothetical protein
MAGFVYIMSNPSFPGLIKIGKSGKDPEGRMNELDGTGLPTPFKLEFSALVDNHHKFERELHIHFDYARANKQREFFAVPIKEVIAKIISSDEFRYTLDEYEGETIEATKAVTKEVQQLNPKNNRLERCYKCGQEVVEVQSELYSTRCQDCYKFSLTPPLLKEEVFNRTPKTGLTAADRHGGIWKP